MEMKANAYNGLLHVVPTALDIVAGVLQISDLLVARTQATQALLTAPETTLKQETKGELKLYMAASTAG